MRISPEGKLSEEQVHALLAEYLVAKDVAKRDKIVLQYKNLVESIARRFAGSGEPLEDLVQEGYIGLITATDLYDIEKGVKFSTYATHFIIGQIKHALRDKGKIIKEPAWLQELNHKMTRVIDSLSQELGRYPTDAEIGKVMHLPEDTISDVLTTREIFKVASLDYDQDENSSGGVDMEKVKDDRYTIFQLPVEDKIVLETATNKLKVVEQKVIQEFYFNGLTQTEIAKKLGISCNYVSHILRSGTRKLRRILTTEELKEVQMQLQLAARRADSSAGSASMEIIDSLTGLYGEAYLYDRLEEELNRAARDKSEVAFAIVAVDGLEEFGMRFGAMHRDDAVCSLAQAIKCSVRRCDVVGRLSDDEFGLILLHTNSQADTVCRRVREAAASARFDMGRSHSAVTFDASVGYSLYPENGTDTDSLMNAARTALDSSRKQRLPDAA